MAQTLSGGEAQVRALVSDPALVLLDEPFAALDAITRLRMHDLVRALHHRHRATMLPSCPLVRRPSGRW